MKVLIVSNGSISNYNFYNDILKTVDYIICADGGAKHLVKMDVYPNVVIGDLDSIDKKIKELFISKNVEFVKFPTNKDATDTELAVDFAISQKPTEITFIGAIGNRMDHTLANISILKKLLLKGVKGKIIDEKNEIILIDKEIILYRGNSDFISILPVTQEVKGVTLEGLQFPLRDALITFGSSIGVSNRFVDSKASIKIKEGLLLIIKSKD